MADFTIISNITNGAGLQKDYELLKRMLESYGHKVRGEMFNAGDPTFRRSDVNIFLEVVNPRHIPYAHQNWIVPNSEWWYPEWDRNLNNFNKVICKTKDCLALWSAKVGPAKCVYTGFEANDIYREGVPRKRQFLHLAGKSETKNTATVMAAWRDFKLPYPLIVSAFKPEIVRLTRGVPNVTQVDRFPDVETVMNESLFHIMPSKNEGFGHAIHEALGCKGVVITTDAPPMNEFSGIHTPLLVPVLRKAPRLMTQFYEVSAQAVAQAVHAAWQLYPDQIEKAGETARQGFLQDREHFRSTFAEVVRASV